MLGMAALSSLPGSPSPGHLRAGTCCLSLSPFRVVRLARFSVWWVIFSCVLDIVGLCGEILSHLLSKQHPC